jgi:hypothetical protein
MSLSLSGAAFINTKYKMRIACRNNLESERKSKDDVTGWLRRD